MTRNMILMLTLTVLVSVFTAAVPLHAAVTVTGQVNINQANAEELARLPYIGLRKAVRIVEYRQQYGAFKEVDEMVKIPGIGEKILNRIRPYITLKGETTLQSTESRPQRAKKS